MSAFVDALRAADKAASPAPFRFANDNIYDSRGDCVVRYGDEVGPYLGGVNDDLFILLRNAAPEIAALVEAAGRLVVRCDGDEGVRADGSNIDTLAVHAALAALDAKVTP